MILRSWQSPKCYAHERREGKPIAVPSKAAVNLIEELEGYITKPPEVIPTFQRDVFVCSPEDQLP